MGRSRRVALTVPNFMLACALAAETGLVATLSESIVTRHGARFGLICTPVPLPMRRLQVRAVMPKVAMMDAGLEWLFDLLKTRLGSA
jgi:DNA-binding transcriptional LysR family regulator